MKTIIKTFFVFGIILIIATSCFTSVSFNKPAPPEIMLEEPKNNIAFINAFDYTIPDEASKSENNVYRTGVTEVIDGLKTSFAYNEQIYFSGDLIDRSMDALSSLYTSRPALSGIIAFTPSLDKAEEEIGHLAKIVGEEYVKKFYPGTELVNRKIYVGKELL